MAIQKNITIDGIDVPFKASAAVPRLYRLKFRRDIYQDFAALQKSVGENTEESSDSTQADENSDAGENADTEATETAE